MRTSTVQELRRALSALEKEKKRIDEITRGIRLLLEDKDSVTVTRTDRSGTGLRDFIRTVVSENVDGISATRVADLVMKQGFNHNGKTPLRQRVIQELSLMKRAGELERQDGLGESVRASESLFLTGPARRAG